MSENHDIYRKLQKRLDKLPIGFPPTDSGVEVELLKSLFSSQEAEITIHLKLLLKCRTPKWDLRRLRAVTLYIF